MMKEAQLEGGTDTTEGFGQKRFRSGHENAENGKNKDTAEGFWLKTFRCVHCYF